MTKLKAAWRLPALVASLLGSAAAVAEPGFIGRQVAAFKDSEIVFQRSGSYVPFPPIASLSVSHYDDAKVERTGRGETVKYRLDTVSQAAGVPWLIGTRDALVIGEYVSWSGFDLEGSERQDFEVLSLGIPIAWLRQVNPDWQASAFLFPVGHRSNFDSAGWSWQTMAGGFARYVQTERLWWAFGFYADIAPGEDFYIPYLGASWSINQHWTLSAVMPWPAILYAPDADWLLRFGVTPSGASWSLSPEAAGSDVAMNLDAWDLGLSVERRIAGGFGASLEVGVGGFRGLRLDGSEFKDAEFEISTSPFVQLSFNFRPGPFE